MARASASLRAVTWVAVSMPSASQPASRLAVISRPRVRAVCRMVVRVGFEGSFGVFSANLMPAPRPHTVPGIERAKKKDPKVLFPGSAESSVALAAKDAQQGQQALEDVEQAQVQAQRGTDVVGFAAVHDER